MTIEEFKSWLDGYTEGKNGLVQSEVEVVKSKLNSVLGFVNVPYIQTVECNGTPYCSHGGCCEYDYSSTSPHCIKCGNIQLTFGTTITDYDASNITLTIFP